MKAPEQQLMVAPYHNRRILMAEATRLSRRGDIRLINPKPVWSQDEGVWVLPVYRLRPQAPRWARNAIAAGATASGLSALFLIGWWVLASLSAPALLALCVAAGAALAALVRATIWRPRVTVTSTVKVTVR